MKRRLLFALAGLALAAGPVRAYEATKELSIGGYGNPHTVALTSYTWTVVPSSSTLTRRGGFSISNPYSNSGNVVAHLGNCTSTSIATTKRPFEILRGNGFQVFPVDETICIWAMTLSTFTESVHVQEVRQ